MRRWIETKTFKYKQDMLADDDEYFPNSNINFAECNKQRDGESTNSRPRDAAAG